VIFVNNEINEKLKTLPDKSGVYIMRDCSGEVIYVGKAKNLKNRVRSYFKSHTHPPKVASMVSNVESFEYIITDSELEALVLENNLIKENMPKYNILLKDDKTYPFLKITVNEDFPRIFLTRKILKDGELYFGPYQSSYDLKQLINLVKEIFSLRFCHTEFVGNFTAKRGCLYYQLGKCRGVCNKAITKEEYRSLINKAIDFINGHTTEAVSSLTQQMKEASDAFDFERAALCRDRLKAIEILGEKQKIVNPKGNDTDAIAVYNANNMACIQLFFIRSGKMVGRERYFITDTYGITDAEIMSEFLRCYYEESTFIPKNIFVECEIEDVSVYEKWISDKAGMKVSINVPKRGENAKLMRMIKANAKKEHSERELKTLRDISFKNSALTELKEILRLEIPPMLIEAYDISNFGDNTSVASMVVYKDGKPYLKKYRNFKIKNVPVQDDYASMKEAISRRLQRARSENEAITNGIMKVEDAKFLPMPDVIFVDGGEGHRNAVKGVLNDFGINIPLFGIVKDDNHRTRGVVGEDGEIDIDKKSDSFMLLTNIQDEMHRRAISHLRKSEQSKTSYSELDKISGVGEKKKKILLMNFKSMTRIKNASLEELKNIKGIDSKAAKNIYEYFSKQRED
jgi:excinuclease ABC subunit C